MMDIEEIRQSPRQFVDLETVEWLSDRVMVLEMQLAKITEKARAEYLAAIDWAGRHQELTQQLTECKETTQHLCMALADTEALEIGTAEALLSCQAALALKDEAIDKYGHNTFCERGVAISMFKKTEQPCTCYMREALAIKPDNAALREWGARLLEELQRVQIETYGGAGLLPHELREVAQDLRSGEWTQLRHAGYDPQEEI